jgi:hypothetical protein
MKRILVLFLGAGLVVGASAGLSGGEDCALAKDPKKPPERRQIPLASVYYSFPQEGTKLLDHGSNDKECRNRLIRLKEKLTKTGASNVILARGDSVAEAVEASWLAFCQSEPASSAVPPSVGCKSNQFWLITFLGTDGSHGEWEIKGAEISGNRIRFLYQQREPGVTLFDMRPYVACVPLGSLTPGRYALELYETRRKHPTLMRSVTIAARDARLWQGANRAATVGADFRQRELPPQDATRRIPLGSIYYSSSQRETKIIDTGRNDKECREQLWELFRALEYIGPSNLHLARGDSVAEAVVASLFVFAGTDSADWPVASNRSTRSEEYWLAAYLGTTGNHGEWILKEAAVRGDSIRLSYEVREAGPINFGMHPYIAWVPVGKLKPGSYVLELRDARSEEVTFSRSVTVREVKRR